MTYLIFQYLASLDGNLELFGYKKKLLAECGKRHELSVDIRVTQGFQVSFLFCFWWLAEVYIAVDFDWLNQDRLQKA